MDTNTTPVEPTTAHDPQARPQLVRPVSGRAIAGVAAGIARYLNISVGLVRVAFLIAIVFGGLGFALYGAGWLLIRDEAESESIAQRLVGNIGSGPSWIGAGLLIVGAVIVLANFTFFPDSLVWALVLVVAGYLLYRGDIGAGRATTASEGIESASTAPAVTPAATPSGEAAVPPAPPAPRRPVPSTPAPPPPPPPPPSILGRLTIGMALLALGVMAVIDNATDLVDPRPRHYLALATVVLGLGLLTGALAGRARWMILLGIFLVPPLVASPAAEVDWEGRFERIVRPDDLAELAPAYEAGAGRFVFDLTEATWDGAEADLTVDLAAGEVVVIVPEGVAITGSGTVSIGQITAPSGRRGGVGDVERSFDVAGDDGRLDLDLEVGVGSIRVESGTPGFGGFWGESNLAPRDVTDLEDIERGTGDLTVDLTDLVLEGDADYQVELGAGRIEVLVPQDLNVVIDADAAAGSITLFDSSQSGLGTSASYDHIAASGPVLTLDLRVGTGDIIVTERSH